MADFLEKLKKGMGEEKVVKKPKKKAIKEPEIKEDFKLEEPKKKNKIEIVKEERDKYQRVEKAEKKTEWLETEGQLTIDVYQTNGDIVIQSAIAGVRPEEIDISIENDTVLIKGERQKTIEKEEPNYFYQECYWGKFSREVILPAEVDSSRAKASIKDGILTIRIPKIEREKKRKVEVKE